MTARDRKIVLVIVPVLALAAYWFLILGPKRSALARADATLAKAEQRRDQAVGEVSNLEAAKAQFDRDYATVVRLGKAIPTSVDMPTLIVQLDHAARGTGIRFDKVATGSASGQPGSSAGTSGSSGGQSGTGGGKAGSTSTSPPPAAPAGNAAAGGAGAVSGPGRATETAGNKVKSANAKSSAAESSTAAQGDGGSSQGSKAGGSKGGSGSPGAAGASQGSPGAAAQGLVSVPLTFTFTGGFFDLADFFHQLKRFVRVANGRIQVHGRLMTIDDLNFTTDNASGRLTADVSATVYLAPKAEGLTAGATPNGPAGATSQPAGGGASGPAPPAATVTP